MEPIDRRTYLLVLGGGAIVFAGCAGDDGESDDEPTDESAVAEADDEADSTEESDANAAETEEVDENDDDENDDDDDDQESDDPATAQVGELLEVGDVRLVVEDFELADDVVVQTNGGLRGPSDEVLEAESGSAFGVVDLALQYVGDDSVAEMDELLEVELRFDGDGVGNGENASGETRGERVATVEPDALEEGDQVTDVDGVRLASGELARGDLVYELADDAADPVLDLEFEASDESVVVDLESAVDSPESLEYELDDDDVFSFPRAVETAGIEVAVTSLEHGNDLGGFMQSDEGDETVAVGVSFRNESGRERSLSSTQAQLKDEYGRSYDESVGMVPALEGFDGEIEDGEEYDGTVAYQLEEGRSELYWVFDAGEWGDERRVFWTLR